MSSDNRKKFRIPDSYQKDTHLGNWLRKNMMPNLKDVYIRDKYDRGTLSKRSVSFLHSDMICCFEDGNRVQMSFSENLIMEKGL